MLRLVDAPSRVTVASNLETPKDSNVPVVNLLVTSALASNLASAVTSMVFVVNLPSVRVMLPATEV